MVVDSSHNQKRTVMKIQKKAKRTPQQELANLKFRQEFYEDKVKSIHEGLACNGDLDNFFREEFAAYDSEEDEDTKDEIFAEIQHEMFHDDFIFDYFSQDYKPERGTSNEFDRHDYYLFLRDKVLETLWNCQNELKSQSSINQ
jgi:hypothetical protein